MEMIKLFLIVQNGQISLKKENCYTLNMTSLMKKLKKRT